MKRLNRKRLLRALWAAVGIGFTGWIYFGFQATNLPPDATQSSSTVQVKDSQSGTEFRPISARSRTGLLFLPGGMVEPDAYTPLLRRISEAGYTAKLLDLPMRCACTGSQVRELFDEIEQIVREGRWILAGHSRGAMLSARYVHERTTLPAGLALLGTTHPRDFSLASLTIPVMKIYGTRDGVAPVSKSNRELLPDNTLWVPIEGGNHVQFGYYRHQLFDDSATISREEQQKQVAAALIRLLADDRL